MTLGTQEQYAEHLGVKPAYITSLKNQGRLVLVGRGKRKKVDFEASDQLIKDTESPDKQAVVQRHVQERQQKLEEADIEQAPTKVSSAYHQSRARKEEYAADMLKLSLDKEKGLLLVITEVLSVVMDGDTIIRNRLETLPDKMAPLLAVETDEQRIRGMLIDQIEYMLSELSQTLKKLETV